MTGKKAQRRENRIKAAIAAGRKTFSQLREERWFNASQQEREDRYKFKNLGHRKHGMLGVG